MNGTSVAKENVNLQNFWKEKEKNARDSLEKIEILKNFRHKDIVVIGYPGGIPLITIRQVCKCVKKSSVYFDFFYHEFLSVGHRKEFHFVRNETTLHEKYEEFQKNNGRQLSGVQDIGEFRIGKISVDLELVDEADFTLYCVDEDFVI